MVLPCAIIACTSGGGDAPAPAPSGPAQAPDSGGGFFFQKGVLSGLNTDCGASHSRPTPRDASADAAASGDGPACTPTRTVHFASDIKPIFTRCGGEVCHSNTWGSGDPYPYIVRVPATECCDGRLRIAPGDPAASYVIQKLTGQHLCRGSRMPLDQVPLSDAEIQTLSDWICLGAPND